MAQGPGGGPDLVIAGAARSGTTQLAAQLSVHPSIDAGAVKEPNFFSKNFDRGSEWYESLYLPRSTRPVRLDASVSYTYPQYPSALTRLVEASPEATVVYVVRDPVARAVSHYMLNHHYFGHEKASDFGTALESSSFYLEVGDYARWISALLGLYPDHRVVVVPFEALKTSAGQVTAVICSQLSLDPPPEDDRRARGHQNNVVTFRSEWARTATRRFRHSSIYPRVRRALGPHVVKRLRSTLTTVPPMPTLEEALDSCSSRQRASLESLRERSDDAVTARLREQDDRLGLTWAEAWRSGG